MPTKGGLGTWRPKYELKASYSNIAGGLPENSCHSFIDLRSQKDNHYLFETQKENFHHFCLIV